MLKTRSIVALTCSSGVIAKSGDGLPKHSTSVKTQNPRCRLIGTIPLLTELEVPSILSG